MTHPPVPKNPPRIPAKMPNIISEIITKISIMNQKITLASQYKYDVVSVAILLLYFSCDDFPKSRP